LKTIKGSDYEAFEKNLNKFRQFMNKADDAYFNRRRL